MRAESGYDLILLIIVLSLAFTAAYLGLQVEDKNKQIRSLDEQIIMLEELVRT